MAGEVLETFALRQAPAGTNITASAAVGAKISRVEFEERVQKVPKRGPSNRGGMDGLVGRGAAHTIVGAAQEGGGRRLDVQRFKPDEMACANP